MSDTLTASDFSAFFQELWGYPAFPWQQRLATQVCETGRWPDQLALPTGVGKTAAIDIALFHLAYDVARGGGRIAPLRIAFVVDRRLIVDEAYDRARAIAERLNAAATDVMRRVANALAKLAGDGEPPLCAQRMRGGIPREGDWARTPTQPTVLSSTVDQVGSRLLFRGYGVSTRMAPIHAGLLGEDALILLDEVHLSEAFRQTLAGIAAHCAKERCARTWSFVELSATPRAGGDHFSLNADDARNVVLQRRVEASKPATLVHVKKTSFESREHAARIAEEAIARSSFGRNPDGNHVLVVVNRVQLARRVYEAIRERLTDLGEDDERRLLLMIGRGRDIEKDAVRNAVVTRCRSAVEDSPIVDTAPLFVVATQTVEAGADLDFDVLVSEIAPLDSLRQRFGRLNRMGRDIQADAAVVAVDAEIAASAKSDPIYGDALRSTWTWLAARAESLPDARIDFAVQALVLDGDVQAMRSPAKNAPILMPEHIFAWAHTREAPSWTPDPGLYLHGAQEQAEVNVVWRADLARPSAADGVEREVAQAVLQLVPPRRGEILAMPIGEVRRWLRGERVIKTGDVEVEIEVGEKADSKPDLDGAVGEDVSSLPDGQGGFEGDRPSGPTVGDETEREGGAPRGEARDASPPTASRMAFRWQGDDSAVQVVDARTIAPGDTLVVPATYGGCDQFGWAPASRRAVLDLGDEASRPYGRSYAFRVHRALLEQEIRREQEGQIGPTVQAELQNRIDIVWAAVRGCLSPDGTAFSSAGVIDDLPRSWKEAFEALGPSSRIVRAYASDEGSDEIPSAFILEATRLVHFATVAEPSVESATESDDIGLQGAEAETLRHHSEAVEHLARGYAQRLGLASALVQDIALAAFLHDLGKADRRFQVYLVGDEWHVADVLAKSGTRRSPRRDAAIRRAARLPQGWRHEALSVTIAMEHYRFTTANDPELVLWLIGSHHGFGRPDFPHWDPSDDAVSRSFDGFDGGPLSVGRGAAPGRTDFAITVVEDNAPRRVDWKQMFRRLMTRYGVWGLARLESIVRLADHRASEVGWRRALELGALTASQDGSR